MKWYALTHKGAEKALQNELKRFKIDAEIKEGGCSFEASPLKAGQIVYHIQTATRILLAVDEGPLDQLYLNKVHEIIPKNKTFKVESKVFGEDSSSVDVSAKLGEQVDRKVNLSKPDFTIFCQVNEVCLCGIDVAGDLSKRYYRIFSNSKSVKGTFAACILFTYDLSGGIIDPFGNTGEVAIEAALFHSNTSPLKFNKHMKTNIIEKDWVDSEKKCEDVWCLDSQLGNLRSCKKNAKLAGVEKSIKFSKLETEWLDVKFAENEASNIVTIAPPVTIRNPETDHLKELLYQAEFILKEKGKLVVCCVNEDTKKALMEEAKQFKLKLIDESIIFSGKKENYVMCYEL